MEQKYLKWIPCLKFVLFTVAWDPWLTTVLFTTSNLFIQVHLQCNFFCFISLVRHTKPLHDITHYHKQFETWFTSLPVCTVKFLISGEWRSWWCKNARYLRAQGFHPNGVGEVAATHRVVAAQRGGWQQQQPHASFLSPPKPRLEIPVSKIPHNRDFTVRYLGTRGTRSLRHNATIY